MDIYNKGIVPRGDKFKESLDLKGEVYLFIKETLEKTSEKAFEKEGFPQADKPAGVYADGRGYGMGAATSHYNIKVGGQTQAMLEKQISFGAKRMFVEVHIAIHASTETLEMKYRTTESSAFRGYHSAVGPMMINEQLHFDLKNMEKFKKDLTEKMKEFAEKEVAYMTSTKLGAEDPIEKSTASIVEAKRLSVHDVFFASDEEFLAKLNENNPDECDDLLLSDKAMYEANQDTVDSVVDKSVLGRDVVIKDKEEMDRFGQIGTVMSFVRPTERDANSGLPIISYVVQFDNGESETFIRSQFSDLDTAMSDEKLQHAIKEITTAGTGVGSIGGVEYDAPMTPVAKRKFKDTPYAKRKRMNEDKGNWAPMLTESDDGFWTVVSQDVLNRYKKNHIMGAPGAENIEINSESESEFNSGGVQKFPQGKAFKDGDFEKHNKMKEEAVAAQKASISEYLKIDPSVRKKWNHETPVTKEAMSERWNRLCTIDTYETIRKAESVTPDIISESVVIKNEKEVEEPYVNGQDVNEGDVVNGKKIIKVKKKDSRFVVEYLVHEVDYLNEGKAYIHDYITDALVNNPNYKGTK